MRALEIGFAALCAVVATAAEPACAQSADAVRIDRTWQVIPERPTSVSDLLVRMEREARLDFTPRQASMPASTRFDRLPGQPDRIRSEQGVRYGDAGFGDTLRLRTEGRLRRADGSPLPAGLAEAARLDAEGYDVTYLRDWTETLGHTETGLDVTLTPHVGVGVGSRGGRTEAGATLKIGPDLDKLVRDGREAFGDRPRWYVYAAGSGTAVGYNFARNRDGDYARSGVSKDDGSFLGDASIGLAMRRGALHGSVGLVYREIESDALRGDHGMATDVTEGLVAFQLSIKPD